MSLRLKTLKEILDTPQAESEDGECDYRRGYTQGYSQAMDDMEMHGWTKCAKFFDSKLMNWRAADHMGSLVLPPEL